MADEEPSSYADPDPHADGSPPPAGGGGGSGGGGAAAATPASNDGDACSWREAFDAAVARAGEPSDRWRAVCREYEALFASHQAALREIGGLKSQLQESNATSLAAAVANAAAAAAAAAAPASGAGAAAAAASEKQVQALQARLIASQDALLLEREKERRAVAERLRLVESNQRLSEEAAALRRGAERYGAERDGLVASEAGARGAAERATAEAALLRADVLALRGELRRSTAEREELLAQLSTLTSNRLGSAAEAVERVNGGNEELARASRARETAEARLCDALSRAAAGEAAAARAEAELTLLRGALARARAAAGASVGAALPAEAPPPPPPPAPAVAHVAAPAPAAEAGTDAPPPPARATPPLPSLPAPLASAPASAAAAAATAAAAAAAGALTGAAATAKNAFGSAFSFVSSALGGARGVGAPSPGGEGGGGGGLHATSASLALASGAFHTVMHAELPVPAKQRARFALGARPLVALQFMDPAGTRVAAAEGARITFLELKGGGGAPSPTGYLALPQPGVDVCSFVVGPRAAFGGGSDASLFFWDAATRACTKTLTGSHSGPVCSLLFLAHEFSPAGGGGGGPGAGCLVSGATMDGTVKVWDPRERGSRPAQTANVRSHINALAACGWDGNSVFVGCQDGRVRRVDLRAGAAASGGWPSVQPVGAALPAVSGLAAAPAGAHGLPAQLLASTRDSGGGSALVALDAATLEPLPRVAPMRHSSFALPSRTSRAVLSPCGAHAVAGGASGALFSWHVGGAGEFEVQVGAGGARRRRRGAQQQQPCGGGDAVLMGGAFAELAAEDAACEEEARVGHAGAPATVVAFAPEGALMASGDADGVVCFWEAGGE
jgi:hypothetical protein